MEREAMHLGSGARQVYEELVEEVRKAAEQLHETMIRFAENPPTNPQDPIVAEWDAAHERAQKARESVREFWLRRP